MSNDLLESTTLNFACPECGHEIGPNDLTHMASNGADEVHEQCCRTCKSNGETHE
jgi:transcription initiation factor IIE alpha subunit